MAFGPTSSPGAVTGANVIDGSLGAAELQPVVPTTDVAPGELVLTSGDAYPQATVNTTGAAFRLAGGIGSRKVTVVDFAQGAGDTVTVTVNGSATVLTAGVDFTAGTSNNVTATNIATAISAVSGVSAAAVAAVVYITPAATTYSVALATGDANAWTVSSGTDGQVVISGGVGGDGSALTSLNASNLASGTVADARLSSNIPLKDATNTFAENLTASKLVNAAGVRINSGPVFMAQIAAPETRPDATALVAGDIWIETDADPGICEWMYYLDGATPRWLSRQIFRRRVTPEWLNSGAGEVDAFEGLPTGMDAYLLSLQGPFYSTSVDAGNHVVVNITTKSSNTSHATWDSFGTVTAATWTQVDVAINVFVNLATPTPDDVGFLVSAVTTGAPAMYGALFMGYRVARR